MEKKSKKILSEISIGELLDKISILEIKIEKITNKISQENLKKEYQILKENQNSNIKLEGETKNLFNSLKNINLKLWDIEDNLRIFEKNKNFGKEFVRLAREVYLNNDKRSKIKSDINKLLGSNIIEVKQYIDYKT